VVAAILRVLMDTSSASGDPAAEIARVAGEFDLTLDPAVHSSLRAFVALFLTWNRSINLASVRAADELVARHLVDAMALAAMVGRVVGTAIDVGSGGGLPAIPLAVLLGSTEFQLFEPNRKKAAFLRTAVRELALAGRVRIKTESVDDPPAPTLRGRFDLALSRATLAPPAWLALGRKLVRSGGQVAVFAAGHSDAGLPGASSSLSYGEGRRLLLFGE